MISATKKMKFSLCITTNERREWRPPWRLVETSPNATKRIEWRPPWQTRFVNGRQERFEARGIDVYPRSPPFPCSMFSNCTISTCCHAHNSPTFHEYSLLFGIFLLIVC
ncbi:hypothetical protein HanIR_Chr13g0664171 [Helianthus annuus]|nr:hypothetical protein HanIR_Chr13g0664171 [Helianthus annuus]